MATVNWTDKAIGALDGIFDYLSHEAPLYATHIVQQIIGSVDRLEAHPLSGRVVPEAEREDIREVICQQYRIIYWLVSEERLDILGVLHSRRDLGQPGNQPWDTH
jgi:toxin ParE1/3/4